MTEVAVVVPTRDRSRLLGTTLQSILWQRGVDLQVFVVDDGSTDDTPLVVAALADSRVRIVRHATAQGVAAARNRGVAEATAAWVAFCDDDDLWAPGKLRAQLDAAHGAHRPWAYAGAVYVDWRLRVRGGAPPLAPEEMLRRLRRYNPLPAGASNVMVSADVLRQTGAFDPSLRHMADWDLWLRLARAGRPAWVPRPLVGYRIHRANASFDTRGMLAECRELEQRHALVADRTRLLRHLAWLSLRAGNQADAVGYLLRAATSRSGRYAAAELSHDVRMLRNYLVDAMCRRRGRPPSPGARARWERARRRDPHRQWKARAQVWLDELSAL